MTDDADLRSFLAAFSKIADLATRLDTTSGQKRFADAVTERLGTDAAALTVLTEDIPPHRYLDWDIALGRLMAQDPDAVLLGIGGGQARYHQVLGDILADRWTNFPVGQVDYVNLPSGPDTTHQAIGLGARSFTYRGSPVLVFQRRGGLDGDVAPAVDVMSTDAGVAVTLLDELRRLSDQTSVLRGQVLTLGLGGNHRPVYQFLPRTRVPASDVILPPGTLERIGGHVQGIARHADRLRAHGQHLKRGVLLYGPPGTGKTHTVRHLLGELDGHTVVLLRGQALTMISQAAAMARTMQPSVVVLEDCDLVAEDRSFDGSTGVLFEVLDAVDGIDGDVDVTFVLTTNRIDVLEEALVQRPGRVDLAVEIPLPDEDGRRGLLALYSGGIGFSDEALSEAAARSEGMTGSFAKELTRRAVLRAIAEDRKPTDDDLLSALDEQLRDTETLRRHLAHDSVESEDDLEFFDEE